MSKRMFQYTCAQCNSPVSKEGTGLGTWHCQGGCKKRHFTVERFIGCGKESEKGRREAWGVRRAVRVRRERVHA